MLLPRRALVVLLPLLLLMGPAAAPAAAETTIDFETLPGGAAATNGMALDTEYSPLGVTFTTVGATTLPRIYTLGGFARSGSNIANASDCSPGSGSEFCSGRIRGDFSELRSYVTVWVGSWSSTTGSMVTLRAYDANGLQVGTDQTAPVPGGSEFLQPLTVSALPAGQKILYFTLEGTGRFGFDDLTFDSTPSATPAFSIARSDAFLDPGITKGTSKVVTVAITRTASSTGSIDLSVSNLPAGVSATIAPNPYTAAGPGTGTATITLAASAAAPSGSSPSTVTVTATPASPTAGVGARTFTFPLIVRPTYDAQITTMEVTQGIQEFDLPERTDTSATSRLPYDGVPLVAGKKTIVRVFANLAAGPAAGVPGTTVALYGVRGAGVLAGSPLMPEWGERRLTIGGPYPSFASERLNPNGAFTFTLPPSWTAGTLQLRAVLSGPNSVIASAADECADCRANNTFNLTDIGFTRMGQPQVTTLSMEYTRAGRKVVPMSASSAFARLSELAPFGEGDLWIPPYEASIDVSDIANATGIRYFDPLCLCFKVRAITSDDKNTRTLDRIESYERRRRERDSSLGSFLTIGVNTGVARGLHRRINIPDLEVFGQTILPRGKKSVAVVEQNRPLTSVAHETWHAFGAPHASSCTKPGGSDPKVTEAWPPDERGYLQGVGIDTWPGSGGTRGPYRMLGVGTPTPTSEWYDLMSYCASTNDTDSWVSPRNWRRVVDGFRARQLSPGSKRRSTSARAVQRAATSQELLHVSAYTDAVDGPLVLSSIEHLAGDPVAADPSATYQLVGRNAAGAAVATAPMTVEESTAAQGGTTYSISGLVPARGVVRVDVERSGSVVLSQTASASAPTVRLKAPSVGAVVPRAGARTITLAYAAADRNKDELTVTVEYSANGGRTWKAVHVGPADGTATVAAGMLARSTNARIRVRVNDGFRQSIATSARFTSLGAAPTALLLSPRPGLRVAQDATVVLAGQGWGDAGTRLAPPRLRWFVGSRPVGSGTRLSATSLPVGRQAVRLVVTDAFGRTGSASVAVVVTRVRPRFTMLAVPRTAPRSAASVRIRVASHVPAQLVIGRMVVSTSRTPRTITVPIPRGSKPATIMLRLSSGRLVSIASRTIART